MATSEISGNSRRSMLSRGLAILDCFTTREAGLTLSDIARQTGLSKATTYRLIGELLDWGLLDRDDRRYYLGRQVAALFDRLPEPSVRIHELLPHTRRVRGAPDRTALVTLLTPGRSLHFDAGTGHRIQEQDLALGQPVTACVAASAKVIAAFDLSPPRPGERAAAPGWTAPDLAGVHDRGYATVRAGDALAAAVPFCDAGGLVRGALSASVPPDGTGQLAVIQQLMSARTALEAAPGRRRRP